METHCVWNLILQSRRCIPRPARCASGAAPDGDGVCADAGAPLLPNSVCGDYEAECDKEIDELEAAGLVPAGGDAADDYAAGDYEAGDSAGAGAGDYDHVAAAPTCTDVESEGGCADYFYCNRGVCKELFGAAGAAAASVKTKPSSAPSPPAVAPAPAPNGAAAAAPAAAPASRPPSAGSAARTAGAGVGAALGAATLLW